MIPTLFVTNKIKQETNDTFTLELKAAKGDTQFSFFPGAFNMVYVFGFGEIPLSISGNPFETDKLFHTVRSVGAVTRKLCDLKSGEAVGIRGPFGTAWPLENASGKDLLLIAGGIGLAPLRPILYHTMAKRKEYKQVILLYGTRTPKDILYQEELQAWKRNPDLQIEITVDRAGPEWHGHVGVVTTLIPQLKVNPRNTTAMICGPEVMMRFTMAVLASIGMNSKDIFISMERNMKCAIGFCGHCQFGPEFICKNGPVFQYDHIQHFFMQREV